MRVALVHDWLNQSGGAEDVLAALARIFPAAPIYTSIYAPERVSAAFRERDVRVSWADRLPGIHRQQQRYLLAFPFAFRGFDLSGYDLILSNKSGFCHGVRKPSGVKHICYCLTPTRYVWDLQGYLERERFHPALPALMRPLMGWLQRWDRRAADGIDHFVAISSAVQRRIARFYGRDSVIIHPPVDTDRFRPSEQKGDYFLVVSRLIPYKRIDLAVQACTRLNLPLIVAGDGRDRARLEALAGPMVQFVGRVPEADLPDLMARCRAFIFPGREDFGIAPVQAMASGRPVTAFAAGGALDYVQA
ncbi:MAG TPA: glycosyltransferase, partial [Anaerolineales bacterium]|nr:glycosyltransferase [Anaerolineales bacterium]